MKQLKFEKSFAEAIKSGDKNATFRVNDDKDIRVGDKVQLVEKINRDKPTTWMIPGELKISEIKEVVLSELKDHKEFRGESFRNVDEMVQSFRRFYGEHIDSNSVVLVFKFDYDPYAHPEHYMQNVSVEGKAPSKVKLYADGGSRGNPGPSASGFVILDQSDNMIHADNKYLGVTTNNQAEYHALLSGLEWCVNEGVREVEVFLDSMLVVNQLKGKFKVKNRDLWSLYETAKSRSEKFSKITYMHVPRELNKLADREVNKALDAVKGSDIVQ